MSRKVNYFEAQRDYTTNEDTHLSLVVSALLPSVLSSIETRKGRSFWIGDAAWSEAYQDLCKQQWELLMDASEYIGRTIFYAMGYPRDVELAADRFPLVEIPEATLFAIRTRLGDPGDFTIYSRLEAIRVLLEAQGVGESEVPGLLNTIILLLSA